MPMNLETLCPSANHKEQGAQLFAVVGGTAEKPETAYLDHVQPITDEVLQLAGDLDPTEVFRFAAPCAKTGCQHFDGEQSSCQLAANVVSLVPVVATGRCGGLSALPAGGDVELCTQRCYAHSGYCNWKSGGPNRNRTYSCPLGGGRFIH